jgi:hypothetical protein
MAAPHYLPWTGDPDNGINPYRPAVADFGGTDKIDDADFPPHPGDPEASEWNQMVKSHAALSQVAPAARILVTFSAGTPSVAGFWATNPELQSSDITVTDLGAGQVRLDIPAAKITDPLWGDARPQATGNHTGHAWRSAANQLTCEIRTAGTLADVNFLAIWG